MESPVVSSAFVAEEPAKCVLQKGWRNSGRDTITPGDNENRRLDGQLRAGAFKPREVRYAKVWKGIG
jgi:hypothetical protein